MKKVLMLLVFMAGPAFADPASDMQATPLRPEEGPANYDLCLSTARSFPEQGLELAGRWEGLGGGEPARHCAAVAFIGLRQYAEAARRLESLATSSKQSNDIRAGMLAQAGQAWFMGGNNDRAYDAQTAALKIAPEKSLQKVDILVDRASTLADSGKYDEAVIDLTAALAIEPRNADALAFRASAYRSLDKVNEALADAEQAVKVDPQNADARLMRGNLYLAQDRRNEARQDWLAAIDAAPDGEAARAARANIERLDLKVEEEKKEKK